MTISRAGLFSGGRRGAPSPSASDVNERILDLIYQRKQLAASALAEAIEQNERELGGQLRALTKLGLLRLSVGQDGVALYSLSEAGAHARKVSYLSIKAEGR